MLKQTLLLYNNDDTIFGFMGNLNEEKGEKFQDTSSYRDPRRSRWGLL